MKAFKKTMVFLTALVAVGTAWGTMTAHAQNSDAVVGKWYTENDKSAVEIWKAGNGYDGKIVWLKDSLRNGKPKLDEKNSNEAMRSKTIVGSQILSDIKYKDGEWLDGKIYDPESGNTYSCNVKMVGQNLELRGYIMGMPFLGRSQTWTRNRKN